MTYDKHIQEIDGRKSKKIFMFTLSTCVWCKKTKVLMKELGLSYQFVDVDLVLDETKAELMQDFEKFNPETSFPTIVIDDGTELIIGFDEGKIRKLKDGK